METTFESIVKGMSAKEIIMAMVDSLTPPPVINIEMNTFGTAERIVEQEKTKFLWWTVKPEKYKFICYGCAATNTICKIAGKTFDPSNIGSRTKRADFLNANFDFLEIFENAIDYLRRGHVKMYNDNARQIGIAEINNVLLKNVPYLANDYTIDELDVYRELANAQS